MLRAPSKIARLVVSASGRAEREFFSDFADRSAAPRRFGKTLRAPEPDSCYALKAASRSIARILANSATLQRG
jgi:hypothetical protein